MIPIPAIDIIDGQCVRLTQGDYQQKKVYDKNPLEVAKKFEAAGLTHLHLVDLDGAKSKQIVNHKVLEKITNQTNLIVDFGGGIKSDQDIKIAFDCGADKITGGTIAVKNRERFLSWIEIYGPEKIILGADVHDGFIAVSGWQEKSQLELFDFLKSYITHGIKYVICTDISKDGLLAGTSLDLYRSIMDTFPGLNLIASGGVTDNQDLAQLQEINCYGAIIGKAIYENRISLNTLQSLLNN